MKDIDRLFLTNCYVKKASPSELLHGTWENTKSMMPDPVRGIGGFLGNAANTASYYMPVIGTGRSLWDAAKAFGKGNWMSGLGNLGVAGLSLLPGGSLVGGSIKGLSRLGVRGVNALKNTGRLGKYMGAPDKGLSRMMSAPGRFIEGTESMAGSIRRNVPGLKWMEPPAAPAAAIGKGRKSFQPAAARGRMPQEGLVPRIARPALSYGGWIPAEKMKSMGREQDEALKSQEGNLMDMFRKTMTPAVVSNPMYARPQESMSDVARQFGSGLQTMAGGMF